MEDDVRFALVFSVTCLAGMLVHEVGHAVAGWVQAIAVVPTPAKDYVLQGQVEWSRQIWISFGGVAGTTVLVLGTAFWYLRASATRRSDAVLAGVFLPLCAYSIRFLLLGRGHDGLEWQAAQAALGVNAAGHGVDILFLCLLAVGIAAWVLRSQPPVRPGLMLKVVGLFLGGIVLVVLIQVTNNALFDRFFPKTTTVHVPAELQSR